MLMFSCICCVVLESSLQNVQVSLYNHGGSYTSCGHKSSHNTLVSSLFHLLIDAGTQNRFKMTYVF